MHNRDWNAQKTKKIIGILGTESGCGVTHLSISLASYISGRYRLCTTVAEYNESHAFASLEQTYEKLLQKEQNLGEFFIRGVRYQKESTLEEIKKLCSAGQDTLIIDFGSFEHGKKEIFKNCSSCIVVLSLREWKMPSFESFMEKTQEDRERSAWYYVTGDGYREDIREFEKRYHIHIFKMPYEKDPFQICRENMKFYESLIERG